MKAREQAFTRNIVTWLRRSRNCHRLESVDVADQISPIGEGPRYPLSRPTRRRDQLKAVVARNRRHMLVDSDLAETNDSDPDGSH
jgi:hypothetical protein